MEPIYFKQSNIFIQRGKKKHPAYVDDNQTITKWRLSFWEAVKVLFSQEIWIHVKGKDTPEIAVETYDCPFQEGKKRRKKDKEECIIVDGNLILKNKTSTIAFTDKGPLNLNPYLIDSPDPDYIKENRSKPTK